VTAGPDAVLTERARPGVELVTLNRPERLNAIDVSLLDGLYAALARLARDETCAVVVLTGAGRGFCAGLDLKGIGPSPVSAGLDGPAAGMRGQAYFGEMPATIRRLPQPVVAAVNGPAYGGGLALANACDLRVAASSARFGTQAIRVGMSGGEMGTTYLLPRLVGAAVAHELILTARDFEPPEAERIGLLSRVVADGTVVDAALDLGESMATHGRAGLVRAKHLLRAGLDTPDLATMLTAVLTAPLTAELTTGPNPAG
jgi:enoyl-CoA hydratase/carnithine racemase